jgi:hypothetical protein
MRNGTGRFPFSDETDAHPPPRDGRNVDERLGILAGEGALQNVEEIDAGRPYERRPWRADSTSDESSYYGIPMLKESVWKWPIPLYFYVGGLAGGSAVLSAAALLRRHRLRRMIRAGRRIAAAGAVVSAALLIQDLGVRRRFIYMLRVFRPTSPMNVGTWILSAFGACATGALLPGRIGDAASVGAGIAGLPLAGYTGVLLANTAVPLWQNAWANLPPVFVASAAASTASAMEMLPLSPTEQRVARRMAVAGKLSSFGADLALERQLKKIEQVGRPLDRGLSGALWKTAKVCKAASLVCSVLPRKPAWLRVTGGLLGTAGALCTRFSLFHGGRASSRDPHATVAMQTA